MDKTLKPAQALTATRESEIGVAVQKNSASMVRELSSNGSNCYALIEPRYADKEPLPYLPSLISGALVIVGWIVVNKMQANRERRKQIREFVSVQMKDLAELEKLIVDYHTAQRNESSEQAFISRLTRFEKSCGMLPKFVANQWIGKATPIQRLIVDPAAIQRMRKAMTLEHFLGEHESPITYSDHRIKEIEIATTEVQEALENVRLAALD